MVKAKKHLGQHFLKNEAQAQRIADALSGKGYDAVLEIGPGTGVLTQFLLQQSKSLKVVELDGESVRYLEQHFPALDGRILPADFLQLDLAKVMEQKPFALEGNFPYNISSQIVFKMLENRQYIPEMAGMFQKEVAERLCAEEGTKVYGILSVLSAVYYERRYLFTVDRLEFNPPPKVQSGVIHFVRKSEGPAHLRYNDLLRVVKSAFNQRRKTLRNALKALNLPLDDLAPELLQKRAEQLSPEEFVSLTQTLYPHEH